jgi:hypothetical protein
MPTGFVSTGLEEAQADHGAGQVQETLEQLGLPIKRHGHLPTAQLPGG